MELLKWIGSSILSIIGLCVALGIIGFIMMFGATLGAIGLGIFLVIFFAICIKEYWDTRSSRTKPRVR